MFPEEAAWFRQRLEKLNPGNVYPMCNLGSSTWLFRSVEQPYIDAELFAPARALGREVVHVDMKPAPGVDFVGDLLDAGVVEQLQRKTFKSVMCCNILEHVVDRRKLCDAVTALIGPGGYIFVSVPNVFPYHEDPIDTMFRPQVSDIVTLFPGMEIVAADIIYASRFMHDMGGSWRGVFWLAVRACVPVYRPRRWAASMRYIAALWHGYRQTCVILRRPASACAEGHTSFEVTAATA